MCCLGAQPAFAQQTPLMLYHQTLGIDCINNSEFRIGPVIMDAPIGSVLDGLGLPTGRVAGEESTFPPKDELWTYDGLTVAFFQGRVSEITLVVPTFETPSGLHLGMSRERFLTMMGREPRFSQTEGNDLYYQVYFCNEGQGFEHGWFFLFVFDGADALRQLMITQDWP